jgi:hypothetical protein
LSGIRGGDLHCYLLEEFGYAARSMSTFGQPKIYPNLNPSAAIPVDREQIFSLRHFADNYRLSRGREHGHYVPNSRFIFVTMTGGETLLHQRYRHPAISQGKPVLYAGEAFFNNGKLEWWSNGSGNYRPDADHAAQAGLPMDQFYPYDEVLKGAHTRGSRPETRIDSAGTGMRPSVQAKFGHAPKQLPAKWNPATGSWLVSKS